MMFRPRYALVYKRAGEWYWRTHSMHTFWWCAWVAGYLMIPIDHIWHIKER